MRLELRSSAFDAGNNLIVMNSLVSGLKPRTRGRPVLQAFVAEKIRGGTRRASSLNFFSANFAFPSESRNQTLHPRS